MKAIDILSRGRALEAPFVVELGDRMIACEEILRLQPGRRVVCRGRDGGREVVLKLFMGARAARDLGRECAGLAAAAACDVPTPEIIATRADTPRAGDGAYLLLAYEHDARPASAVELAELLARLHEGGVCHLDPHRGNFLSNARGTILVDGGGVVRRRRRALGARASLSNFALLLAELCPRDPDVETFDAVVAAYARCRKRAVSPAQRLRLSRMSQRLRARRLERVASKAVRECTQVHCVAAPGRFLAIERSQDDAHLRALLERLDAAVAEGETLKSGNSATVARVCVGPRTFVVKRYNRLGWVKTLRRSVRGGRARRAWKNAHRLVFLDIATALPVALLEERRGPWVQRGFLVTEDVPAEPLGEFVERRGLPEPLLRALTDLLARLDRARLVHGDLKASNLLVADGAIYLLDLDAMRSVSSARRLRRLVGRDRQRLAANWRGTPIADALQRALGNAGL